MKLDPQLLPAGLSEGRKVPSKVQGVAEKSEGDIGDGASSDFTNLLQSLENASIPVLELGSELNSQQSLSESNSNFNRAAHFVFKNVNVALSEKVVNKFAVVDGMSDTIDAAASSDDVSLQYPGNIQPVLLTAEISSKHQIWNANKLFSFPKQSFDEEMKSPSISPGSSTVSARSLPANWLGGEIFAKSNQSQLAANGVTQKPVGDIQTNQLYSTLQKSPVTPTLIQSAAYDISKVHFASVPKLFELPQSQTLPIKFAKFEQSFAHSTFNPDHNSAKTVQIISLASTRIETLKHPTDWAFSGGAHFDTLDAPMIKPNELSDAVRSLVSEMKHARQDSTVLNNQLKPVSAQIKSIQVNLYPRDLGAVEITIRLAGDNATVSIKAQTNAALTLIQNDIDTIQRSIQIAGQTLDEIQVGRLTSPNPQTDGFKGSQGFGENTHSQSFNQAESAANHQEDNGEQEAENRDFLNIQVKTESLEFSTDSRNGIYM